MFISTAFLWLIWWQAFHAYGIPGRQMLRAGNVVAGKRLIGHFKCDIGTIFAAPGDCLSALII